MDLDSWKSGIKRHLESIEDSSLLIILKLVMAEMERRHPVEVYKPQSDAEFLRSCGVRWE